MIQFIQPLWLFAIAAVAIPVIIHLWNIKEGKTLKIGSIRLLSQSSIQNARSLRWLDLLLLILRCLLIALLAVILSKPLWPQNIHQQKHTGWIVIEQQHLGESYSRFRPLIDSLLKAGFEFHYLAPGYKKAAFKNALKQAQRPFDKKQISYWYLLAGLEHEVPPGMQVHLFTTNQVERFTGNRRRVSLNVKWHTYSPVNSSYSMPVDAYISASDSIRVITAESRPSGTYYTARNLAADKQDTVYRITVRDGKMFLSLNDTGNSIHTRSPSIEVDTA
ncbi:MAG: BatA domain-containing protein, partial [Chitinophagaceae bacterium]